MKKILHILAIFTLLAGVGKSQNNIGINTDTPDASSILDIVSEDKGLLIPRLTSSQRTSISNPANGLMVFDVDLDAFSYYSDTENDWIVVPRKSEIYWVKNGDNIYNINAQNVGIGITSPNTNLHIKGRENENSGLTITNGDSTYSIIIVIDINEDGIIVRGDNHINEKLLYQILENGKFGLGTKPSNLLHLKPNIGIEPSIQISNEDSSYNIIIVIDINEDGIIVKGDDTQNERILYSADKIGRFGVGLNKPRNVLHLKSDTLNPNIRLTREGNAFDYVLGFDSLTTDFIIKRMSNLDGSQEDVFVQVTPTGDVNFFSENNVNISPGVSTTEINTEDLTTNQIEFNNPYGGPNPVITVSPDGTLDFGQTIGSSRGILSVNFQQLIYNNSNASDTLRINQNLLPNTPTAFSFTPGRSSITVNESGYYEINYTLAINTSLTGSQFTEITRSLESSSGVTIPNSTFVNEFKPNQNNDESTINFHQIFYFNAGSTFRLRVARSNNQGATTFFSNSNLTIKKIAN